MNARMRPLTQDRSLRSEPSVDLLLQHHWQQLDHFSLEISRMARDFMIHSVVSIRSLIPEALRQAIIEESEEALNRFAVRRDLTEEQTGDSPRHMWNVRQKDIAKVSRYIEEVYQNLAFRTMLSSIAGSQVHCCPYEPERYLITSLQQPGDCQGWHLDDYGIALIWNIQAPVSVKDGGLLQICPNSGRPEPLSIPDLLIANAIHTHPCLASDVYLLRTDISLHRVTKLRRQTRRTILNMTWAIDSDFTRPHDHRSIELLWS